ncbi:hypothetical protein CONLIGDRAFT_153218 [Coniochaeta ligniaria NRRL 30616]|uniref:Uncharacterized protein n=1 Tax=Coniochaeta ligniaria NRRL 30616 TaxID=1408157 RepID=A0A1J7I5R6_9PEZI|nr:hypothetical protein CONLIGDRAFT_153218 [Coniochaeta ligniaria NRRL 30616]
MCFHLPVYVVAETVADPDPTFEAYYALNHLYPVASKIKHPAAHGHSVHISLRGGGPPEEEEEDRMFPGYHSSDFNESDFDPEGSSEPEESDRSGSDHLRSAGILLRGDASISQPPVNKAKEEATEKAKKLVEKAYGPKKPRKHGVHFETTPSQTERSKAGTAKGKEPARDLPQTGTGKGKGKERAHEPPAISNPFMRRVNPKTQPPTREQRQQEMREAAYTKPPSVHTHNDMPQNAPPIEKVLRFGSDNQPMVSLGVLTPTEQRHMQLNYYNMRNILLERSQKCPYRGCDRVISLAEEDRMQQHLADAHMGDKCNFCDEVLYAHWTVNQRRAHFLKQHSDLFLIRNEVEDNNRFGARARPHGQVDYERESRWTYCARCGRDHTDLNARADREYHDTVCYPGAPKDDWAVCVKCGVIHSITERHTCREVANTFEWPYCEDCGLATGLFSELYRATHQLHCKGFNSEDAKYCPWCGLETDSDPSMKLLHMRQCDMCPDEQAEGPLDENFEPWPYKPHVEEQKGEKKQQPPEVCTLCKKTIIHLDAHLLLKHIEDNHPDYTTFCIFCKLDYGERGWGDDRQKILMHLDDHIHDRKEKMAADLVETLDLPANHPFRMHVLRKKDFADVKDMRELKSTKEQYDRLWEASQKTLAESKQDKKVIIGLREELAAAKKKLAEAEEALDAEDAEAAPAPVVTPATPKKDKGKGKGKEKAKPVHKEDVK